MAAVQRQILKGLTCQRERPRLAYIAPTYGQAKRAAWDYLKSLAAPVLAGQPNETELRVDLVNGSRIQCYGAENAEALRGIYLDDACLDEYADMAPSVWPEVIRPALSDRQGGALFIGTPKGRNDFHRIVDEAGRDPNWTQLILRASETGYVADGELEMARRDMTPEQFSQEFECSFDAAIVGAYYGKEIAAAERAGRIGDLVYQQPLPVHTAWDLGIGDSTAIWFFQVVRDEVHVLDHYEAHGQGLPHYAGELAARGYRYGTHFVPHDAGARELGTGRSIEETLRRLLPKSIGSDRPLLRVLPRMDIMDGINAGRLTMAKAWFDAEKCRDGLEALRQYRTEFDEKTKAFRDRPRHDWTSHCLHGATEVLTRNGMRAIKDLPWSGEVLTPCGWKRYRNPRIARKNAPLVEVRFVGGHTVRCTPDHLFLTVEGWRSASSLTRASLIQSALTPSRSISMVASTVFGRVKNTFLAAGRSFIGTFGRLLSGIFPKVVTSTIEMRTPLTIGCPTSNVWTQPSTSKSLGRTTEAAASRPSTFRMLPALPRQLGTLLRKVGSGIVATLNGPSLGLNGAASLVPVLRAEPRSTLSFETVDTVSFIAGRTAAPLLLESVVPLNETADVWDITVPDVECFSLANGAVVHNSADAWRYLALAWREMKPPAYGPDRPRDPYAQKRRPASSGWAV